jgi:hypothetical protein
MVGIIDAPADSDIFRRPADEKENARLFHFRRDARWKAQKVFEKSRSARCAASAYRPTRRRPFSRGVK